MVNWLIGSFINGLIFFLIFVAFFYWFYVKELPTVKPPQYPQFEKFKLSDVTLFTINFLILNKSVYKSFIVDAKKHAQHGELGRQW